MHSSTEHSTDKPIGPTDPDGILDQSANGDGETDSNASIRELREILIGADQVSEILPEAVSKSTSKNSELSEATLPIVEENIRESVLRNPKVLADALFPVIGPAIRKAISAALSTMVQSFNQTLEYSVSPKGLRWRLEAMRTGRTFGEVVMLKTLLYRVEQVFLIHRETGLLLDHVTQNPQDMEDADMVSAMLTAITDFAHDSFKTDGDATLDSFKISGLNVWIESSPDAILAAAIRGNPPLELHETFELAVEKVQLNFERELDSFDGQAEIFAPARPILEECLRFQSEAAKPAGLFSPANVILGFFGLVFLAFVAYFAWDYWRWSGVLEDVRNEPGYVLTDYSHGWTQHSVSGLRDPLASDPAEFLIKNSYDEGDVKFQWREFQDTEPVFVEARLRKLLRLPDGVKLSLEKGVVRIEGTVSTEWRSDAERLALFVPGVSEVKFVDNKTQALIKKVEQTKILFECGTSVVSSEEALKQVTDDLRGIGSAGASELVIIGYTDGNGTPEINNSMVQKRLDFVGSAVRKAIAAVGSGTAFRITKNPAKETNDECKVTFKVIPQKQ